MPAPPHIFHFLFCSSLSFLHFISPSFSGFFHSLRKLKLPCWLVNPQQCFTHFPSCDFALKFLTHIPLFRLSSPLSFYPFVHHSGFHLCCAACCLSLPFSPPPSAFVSIYLIAVSLLFLSLHLLLFSHIILLLCVNAASVSGQDSGPATAPRPAQP